jgi:hypothetical protein
MTHSGGATLTIPGRAPVRLLDGLCALLTAIYVLQKSLGESTVILMTAREVASQATSAGHLLHLPVATLKTAFIEKEIPETKN